MALKIKEFDINYITAVGGKSVNGHKFTNFVDPHFYVTLYYKGSPYICDS